MKNNLSKLSNYLTLNGLFSEAAMIKTAASPSEDIKASFKAIADAVKPSGILQTIKEYLTTNNREYLEKMLLTSSAAYLKDLKNENDKKYIINHIAKQKFKSGIDYDKNKEAQLYVVELRDWVLQCIEAAEKIEEISAVIGAGAASVTPDSKSIKNVTESTVGASTGKGAVTGDGKEKSKPKVKAKSGEGTATKESGGKTGGKARGKGEGKGGKRPKD